MSVIEHFRRLDSRQRHTFLAAFLGWTLDSLDFFLLIFCVKAIAGEFHTQPSAVLGAVFLTQAFRPVGALLFGMLADRYGRRPVLMVNILSFSVIELACAFAPSLSALLVLRALFGIAMGGEWGVGAALAFETLPKEGRGTFSGILQEGYAMGSILASAAFALLLPLRLAGGGCSSWARRRPCWCFMCRRGWPSRRCGWPGRRKRHGARGRATGRGAGADAQLAGVSAHVSVSGAADDGLHELLARHAGRVSDVSCSAGEALAGDDRADRRALRLRVDRGRNCVWGALGEMGPQAGDCDGGAAGDSGDSALRLWAFGV